MKHFIMVIKTDVKTDEFDLHEVWKAGREEEKEEASTVLSYFIQIEKFAQKIAKSFFFNATVTSFGLFKVRTVELSKTAQKFKDT